MGSSQEIKFQSPEEAKRRVKKKFKQVDKEKKIVKDEKKKVGSSQEIKFQSPEEAKRRVKKKFKQVDKEKKIVKDEKKKVGSSQEIKFQSPEEAKRRVKKKFKQVDKDKKIVKDVNSKSDKLKAIKVLKLTGKESEWDHWSEKFVALARARGFAGYAWVQRRHPEQTKRLIKRKHMAPMN